MSFGSGKSYHGEAVINKATPSNSYAFSHHERALVEFKEHVKSLSKRVNFKFIEFDMNITWRAPGTTTFIQH